VDGDGNGVVSPDEFAAAQAEHRRQMMQPRWDWWRGAAAGSAIRNRAWPAAL